MGVTTRQSQAQESDSIHPPSQQVIDTPSAVRTFKTQTDLQYMMTQLINPAPSVHAAPNFKTETTVKAKKFSKRVSWSSELTSVRLITPEVKGMRFRPFPILEEDEEQEEEEVNMRHVNHLL